MEPRSDYTHLQGNTAHGAAEDSLFETLSRVEQDMNGLIDALALLGVKRCFRCKQFFRTTEPGAMFDYGRLVCFGCVPDWWSSQSMELGVVDRERIEAKLSSWLRKYHRAEVVKQTSADLGTGDHGFKVVTTCFECRGSGKLMESERCRFCNGLGTVWVVVPR